MGIPKERQKVYDKILKGYEENFKEKCYCKKHDRWWSKYLSMCPECWEDTPQAKQSIKIFEEFEEEMKNENNNRD